LIRIVGAAKSKAAGVPYAPVLALAEPAPILRNSISRGQMPVNALCNKLAPTNTASQRNCSLTNAGLAGAPSATAIRTKHPAKPRTMRSKDIEIFLRIEK
jgi:hypothetical protein